MRAASLYKYLTLAGCKIKEVWADSSTGGFAILSYDSASLIRMFYDYEALVWYIFKERECIGGGPEPVGLWRKLGLNVSDNFLHIRFREMLITGDMEIDYTFNPARYIGTVLWTVPAEGLLPPGSFYIIPLHEYLPLALYDGETRRLRIL